MSTGVEPIEDVVDPAQKSAPVFFAVSATKLLVLSLFTFSLYELYWFYENWTLVKERERSDISPFWRSVFGFFYCHALFSRVRSGAERDGVGALAAGPLAAGWIITSLLWRLPDPYWLVSYLTVLFLLPVQMTANRINSVVAPGHEPNARFSVWNIFAVVVGGLLLAATIFGMTLPREASN